MAKRIYSATPKGLDAEIVEVEVDISPGLPATYVVGLPDAAIRESRERIRGCFRSSSFKYPIGRIIINLAPADLQKYGTQFDFAIAVGLLCSSSQIKNLNYEHTMFLGELSLDGSIRKIKGCLAMVLEAKSRNLKRVFLSKDNYAEGIIVEGIEIIPLERLDDLLIYTIGKFFPLPKIQVKFVPKNNFTVDFADVKGMLFAKKGLEIAAAGGHNLLMSGVPGSGKTMLAQAFSSILPELDLNESIETIKIHDAFDVSKDLNGSLLINVCRPFRQPHTGITSQAFIGGGLRPRPGEITLAHNGVLFMDEFPEFTREVIESLRQPLESGRITVNRINGYYTFPARFILLAAQNPCPCGFYNDLKKDCMCTPMQIQRYQRKISGPILDRIDMQINVRKVEFIGSTSDQAESSTDIKYRVIRARQRQKLRNPKGFMNAYVSSKDMLAVCNLRADSKVLLNEYEEKYDFSARVYFKIIKLSRTIADLYGSETIDVEHISEALRYKFGE
jgi:magnesium chelatase family protein